MAANTTLTSVATRTATISTTSVISSSISSRSPAPSNTNTNCNPGSIDGGWSHTAGLSGTVCGVSFPPGVLNIRTCCANGTSTDRGYAEGGADVRVDNDCLQYCAIPTVNASVAAREQTFHRCIRDLIQEQVSPTVPGYISLCKNLTNGLATNTGAAATHSARPVSALAFWLVALLGFSVLL